MLTTRRQALGLLGSAIAAPYVLRSEEARAASITPLNIAQIGAGLSGGCQRPILCPHAASGGLVATGVNSDSEVCAFIGRYKANGAPVLAEQLVTDPAGPESTGSPAYDSTCIVTESGEFTLFVSAADKDEPGTSDGINIYSIRCRKNLKRVGHFRLVSSFRKGAQTRPFATKLKNKRVAVIWRSAGPTLNSTDVRGLLANDSGVPLTNDVVLLGGANTPPASGQYTPTDLISVGNRFYFAYTRYHSLTTEVGVDLTPVAPPNKLHSAAAGENDSTAGLLALPGSELLGAHFTVFFKSSGGLKEGTPRADVEAQLRLRQFDRNGGVVRNRVVGKSRIDVFSRSAPKLAALPDGRVVIVTDGLNGSTRSINAWLVSATGKRLLGPIVLHSTSSPLETTSLIRAPNGHFWIAWWENLTSPPSSWRAYMRRFRITG